MSAIVVVALYRFVRLDNYRALHQPLLNQLLKNHIRGTLLLATEGINGTVAGSQKAITHLINWLREDKRFARLNYKLSYSSVMPFYRTRVKLKKEIVTMGVENIDPNKVVGTYVSPKDWNTLISDPEITLIDTRNEYETDIGSFKYAHKANTRTFREFPDYVKQNLNPQKNTKVAMFCTGGIRCEKSTAYLKDLGFNQVYHLEGGILKYLETIPEAESLWQGECFVFDNRVSVDHALRKGSYDQCHACRLPITDTDKTSEKYLAGVSCPTCFNQKTEADRIRFRAREQQVQLAKQRGEQHIGCDVSFIAEQRRNHKIELKNQQRNNQADTL